MPAKKTTAKKTTRKTTRKRRGPAEPRGPEPTQSAIASDDAEISALVAHIRSSRGAVIGAYRDPYGGTPLVFASVPVGAVEATSFQRDLSRTHAERLATAIGDTGAFLDPVIAIPSHDGFLSPNGRHRIAAARQLGQRSITVLATADPALAYRILALNTEKAHNLRDRSLEVIRMARSLAKEQPRSKEKDHATSFESPAFLTLGCAYEKRGEGAAGDGDEEPVSTRSRRRAVQSGSLDPDEEGCWAAHVGRGSAHAHDEERACLRAEEGATTGSGVRRGGGWRGRSLMIAQLRRSCA